MLHQCTRATVAHGVTLGSLIPILNRSIQLFFLVFFSCGIYPRINLPYPTIPSFTTHFWSYWDRFPPRFPSSENARILDPGQTWHWRSHSPAQCVMGVMGASNMGSIMEILELNDLWIFNVFFSIIVPLISVLRTTP